MFELKGKYGTAKVFTDCVDQNSISQVINLLNQEFIDGSRIRMMPDIHAGKGCTVGTTMTIKDKICPNLVGVDIGCGMEVVRLHETQMDLKRLDFVIRSYIPAGFDKRASAHPYFRNTRLSALRCPGKDNSAFEASLGTLGGGNHFIEVDMDSAGRLYLVIHSGSRLLGVKVASYYQKMAVEQMAKRDPKSVQELIEKLKEAGKAKEVQNTLKALFTAPLAGIVQDMAYVTGYLLDDYLHDMEIAQEYAMWSRHAMADTILDKMGLHQEDRFTTVHNYIDTSNMILRKGSVSAQAGEQLIIPMNMRDGSLLCVGKGNPDWNYSAPHGAGRLMSRSEAKEHFS